MNGKNNPLLFFFPMIGVFDSGFGGLQTLKYLRASFPCEDFVFLADNANVPYGNKTEEEIRSLVIHHGEKLFTYGCDHLVIACNTAVASIYKHRFTSHDYQDRLLGVTQCGIADAISSGYKKIAVFCTQATHDMGLYPDLYHSMGGEHTIYTIPTFELVPLIESENLDISLIYRTVEAYRQFLDEDTDCIVLGCTHYPIIVDVFREVFPRIHIVDPGRSSVGRLDEQLTGKQKKKPCGRGTTKIYATRYDEIFISGVQRIWKTSPIPLCSQRHC